MCTEKCHPKFRFFGQISAFADDIAFLFSTGSSNILWIIKESLNVLKQWCAQNGMHCFKDLFFPKPLEY